MTWDQYRIFGYRTEFEHGFALPAYHVDEPSFNAWYLAIPEIPGDHRAFIESFEVLEQEVSGICEGSRIVCTDDVWNDVFLWDGVAYVGTAEEIFAKLKPVRKSIRQEAPLCFLDLILAAGASGADKAAKNALGYARKLLGHEDGGICFVETAVRPGVLLEICRFLKGIYPVERASAIDRIYFSGPDEDSIEVRLDDALFDFLRNEGYAEPIRERISGFGDIIGFRLKLVNGGAALSIPAALERNDKDSVLDATDSDSRIKIHASPDGSLRTVNEIAIDLGTANTRIFAAGIGLVLDEPSLLLVESELGGIRIKSAGINAVAMARADPSGVDLLRPLREGVVTNLAESVGLISGLIGKAALKPRLFRKLKVAAATTSGSTSLERRALRDTLLDAGAGEVWLVEKLMAAAIGADILVDEPIGTMVVDIGAGITEVGVFSLRGLAYRTSVRSGGDKMDEAIVSYVRRYHNLLIGEATAERIKIDVGTACCPADGVGITINIKGRDLVNGVPKEIAINQGQIAEALSESISSIINVIRIALDNTAPELAADIVDQGIVLTGGGALLADLDVAVRNETGLPVTVAEDPSLCTILGLGRILEDKRLRDLLALA